MPGPVRSRLLPGAPGWLLAVLLLTAGLALFSGTGRMAAATAAAPPELLLVAALHGTLLAILVWRARTMAHERAVWIRIALGAGAITATVVAGTVLALVPATREIAAATTLWAPVVAFPLVYGGLVRWNRFSTNLADPNDALNGAAAVLAVVAIANVLLDLSPGPLSAAPVVDGPAGPRPVRCGVRDHRHRGDAAVPRRDGARPPHLARRRVVRRLAGRQRRGPADRRTAGRLGVDRRAGRGRRPRRGRPPPPRPGGAPAGRSHGVDHRRLRRHRRVDGGARGERA